MRQVIELDMRTPVGLTRTVRFSRSGLAKQTKNGLVSIMYDLDLAVPRYIEDYTKADLIETIWDRVLHRGAR